MPFGGGYTSMRAAPERRRRPAAIEGVQTAWRVIGGDYFPAVGIPLRAGRFFERADDRARPTRTTIINDTLAQRLWPGQNPIGRRILVGDSKRPYEVIGVVGQARLTALGREPEPAMYYHYRQFPWTSLTIARPGSGRSAVAGAHGPFAPRSRRSIRSCRSSKCARSTTWSTAPPRRHR